MNDGFIYPIVNFIVEKLDKVNLVELFKYIARWLNKDKTNTLKERTYVRIAVDLFIVVKWLFIFIVWCFRISNSFTTLFVWYLIFSNLHTYFYRHIWCDDAFDNRFWDKERVRRRFVNLILAFSYSNVCFGYLYSVPFAKHMDWGGNVSRLHGLLFSMSNSVAANYNTVNPATDFGNYVAMVQLVVTFLFVSIILSRSVPQPT